MNYLKLLLRGKRFDLSQTLHGPETTMDGKLCYEKKMPREIVSGVCFDVDQYAIVAMFIVPIAGVARAHAVKRLHPHPAPNLEIPNILMEYPQYPNGN